MSVNSVLLTGCAPHDFKTDKKNSGLIIIDGTVAGERQIQTENGERSLPFYLPLTLAGNEGSLAARLATSLPTAGTPLAVVAAFDYTAWGEDEKRQSRVRLKILRIERLSEANELISDSGGGKRMAEAINQATLIGNLTADPEEQGTNDTYRVSLRLAVNERWRNNKGGIEEKVHFIEGTIWRDEAQAFISQQPKRGLPVLLIGAAINDQWTTKDDQKRSTVKIEVIQAKVLKKSKSSEAPAPLGEAAPNRKGRAPQAPADDDDQPF